jgi:membrane protein required for colicin V production
VNLLDILLAAIVAGSVVAGWMAGFARAAIGFIAVVGGILCGFWFYGIPTAWMREVLRSETVANVAGFVVVFFTFQLAGGVAGKVLSKLFQWTGLSFLDRFFGAGFGLVRGALAAVALVAVLMAFTPRPTPNWMAGSAVLPYAVDAADLCAALAPRALKDGVREGMAEIRKVWEDQVRRAERFRNKMQAPEGKPEAEAPAPPKPEPLSKPRPAAEPKPAVKPTGANKRKAKLKVIEQ